ncbi:MAG: hypothetical protein KY460_17100 [Actinobacteria bacterium]|nr:hypothetical protein [Actinomycetota bacterium]
MRPEAPPELLDAIERWAVLSRSERAEVGRALRRLGWTYGEIREVIAVPKGTLAGWCREIRLTGEQIAAIKRRTVTQRGVPRDTQRKRRAEIVRIQADAREFAVANTDPAALRRFIGWVRVHHDPAPTSSSRCTCTGETTRPRPGSGGRRLMLDAPDFTKTFIKPAGTGHRKNRLPYGVCKTRMRRGTDAWYRTLTWITAIAATWAPDSRTTD